MYTCWVSVQNWFAFWPRSPNSDPQVATKWMKLVISDYYLKKYLCNSIETWCGHLLGECSKLLCFLTTLAKFGPLLDRKWQQMVVSDHYLKKYSCNPAHTWCIHLLGECSETICFWPRWPNFWPSSGHEMTGNGAFRPLSEKVFMQSNSNLVCTLGWVFRTDLLFGHVDQILAHYWHQNEWKWLFPTIIWKRIHVILFKLGV